MTNKVVRFGWRALRNLACALPGGKAVLFPAPALAASFGRGDAVYAWSVFRHHEGLRFATSGTGFRRALEVGPGRNLGMALLMWASQKARAPDGDAQVVCWDVYRNADRTDDAFWAGLAGELLAEPSADSDDPAVLEVLRQVSEGRARPAVDYRVEPMSALATWAAATGTAFDLVYSHAAIEHVWRIDQFWDQMRELTAAGGRHSHRIDLADHGGRESNYIEMLEWSGPAYWLTLRFVPGATNRWRASDHVGKLRRLGFDVLLDERMLEPRLPTSRDRLALPYRDLPDEELRAVAVDVVARLGAG
jgi:hypothetical protein